jgi:small subunit ribosomal protein S17
MTAEKGVHGGRKTREGTVVSDKMENTVVVAVQTSRRHPLYKKTIRRVRKFMAHDESGETKLGDIVRIVEISPVSKHKRWGVIEVLEKAELPEVAPESIDLEIIGEIKPEVEEEAPDLTPAALASEVAPTAEAEESEAASASTEEEPAVSEEPEAEVAEAPVEADDVPPEAEADTTADEPETDDAPEEVGESTEETSGDEEPK